MQKIRCLQLCFYFVVFGAAQAPAIAAGRQAPIRITGTPTCASCRIERRVKVEVTDKAMPGALIDYAWVHAASDDRYFVVSGVSGTELYLADRAGVIRKRIGSEGQAPGEFRTPMYVLEYDSSFRVIDPKNARITTLGKRNLGATKTSNFPFFPLSNPVKLGNAFVLNARLQNGPRTEANQPLHMFSVDGVRIRSFGADPRAPIPNPPTARSLTRVVSAGSNGTILVASPSAYRIERWDSAGKLVAIYERDLSWFRPRSLSEPSQGLPHVRQIHEENGVLWVQIGTIKQPPTPGKVAIPFDHSKSETFVEVLDLKSGKAVAAKRFTGFYAFPVMGGLYSSTFSTDNRGEPRVQLWTYDLIR
jgi:hypothetical protein